jgi:hypothetical protein
VWKTFTIDMGRAVILGGRLLPLVALSHHMSLLKLEGAIKGSLLDWVHVFNPIIPLPFPK